MRSSASAVSTVATTLPSRSTVTVEDTASTSLSLCDTKTIARSSAASAFIARNSTSASLGVSTAVGSSRISTRTPRCNSLRISTRCCSPTVNELVTAPGRNRDLVSLHQLCGRALELGAAQEPRRLGLPECDVLSHGKRRHQLEVLVHHADPCRERIRRRAELLLGSSDHDPAGIGSVHPREHRAQGRLARAVFAKNGVDLPLAESEIHAVVGKRTVERLGDALQPHQLSAARGQLEEELPSTFSLYQVQHAANSAGVSIASPSGTTTLPVLSVIGPWNTTSSPVLICCSVWSIWSISL